MSHPADDRPEGAGSTNDMPQWLREARQAHVTAGAESAETAAQAYPPPGRRYVRKPADLPPPPDEYGHAEDNWPNLPKKKAPAGRSNLLRYGLAAAVAAVIASALVVDWTGSKTKTSGKGERIVAASRPEAPVAPSQVATAAPETSANGNIGRYVPTPPDQPQTADEPRRRVQTQAVAPEPRPAADHQVASVAPTATPPSAPMAAPPEPSDNAGSAPPTYTAPAAPARSLSADEIAMLLKRGEDYLNGGDFAAARLMLQRVADAGNARGALMLASTYDPLVLQRLGAYAFAADVAKARAWYEKARDYGSPEAPRRLEMLARTGR